MSLPAELGPVLLALGVVALGAAFGILRSFGPRYRVGRLLAVTPVVGVDEAVAIASGGAERYVRIDGRIDSAAEFEDADHRPLVLRLTRLSARRGRSWVPFEVSREVVPFTLREGLTEIAIDGAALDAGLVVVPRVADGVAADLGDRAPSGMPPGTPVRVVVEQVSSVEHAVVLGVPARGPNGIVMTAGLGRPLILTTLELAEAMRILAGGQTVRPRAAVILFSLGLVDVVAGTVLMVARG